MLFSLDTSPGMHPPLEFTKAQIMEVCSHSLLTILTVTPLDT